MARFLNRKAICCGIRYVFTKGGGSTYVRSQEWQGFWIEKSYAAASGTCSRRAAGLRMSVAREWQGFWIEKQGAGASCARARRATGFCLYGARVWQGV